MDPATIWMSVLRPKSSATAGSRVPTISEQATIVRQLILLNIQAVDQILVVMHICRVAVISYPGSQNGIHRGGEAPGQAQIDIVQDVQEFMRLPVNIRHLVSDVKHMACRVFAGHGWQPAGQTHKAQQVRQADMVDIEKALQLLMQIFGAAHVHP